MVNEINSIQSLIEFIAALDIVIRKSLIAFTFSITSNGMMASMDLVTHKECLMLSTNLPHKMKYKRTSRNK
jgi:hypothetical protein